MHIGLKSSRWNGSMEPFWHPYGIGRKWRAGECLGQVARKPEAAGTSVNIGPGNLSLLCGPAGQ